MIHPDTELRLIDDHIGYGVVASRPIPRGTIVWTLCRFDRIYTAAEAAALPAPYRALVEKFGYIDSAGRYVLCWDLGRYVNHGCEPAMLGLGADHEIAVRDIAAGEHLTCEYGGLNLTAKLACRCGAPTCRGTIGGDDVLALWQEWDARVAAVLPLAARVAQPLLPFVQEPETLDDWVHGRSPLPTHRDGYAGPPPYPAAAGSAPWTILAPGAGSNL